MATHDTFSMDDAVSALGAFRGELMRSELADKAAVQGLEIWDADSAHAALHTVRSIEIPEALEDLRWMTVSALRSVAERQQLVA
jgi:hypothetical protein